MKAVTALTITSLTLTGLSVYIQTHSLIDIMGISALGMIGLGAITMVAAVARASWMLKQVSK